MYPIEIDIAIRKRVLQNRKFYYQRSEDLFQLLRNKYETAERLLLLYQEVIDFIWSELIKTREFLKQDYYNELYRFLEHCTEEDIKELEAMDTKETDARWMSAIRQSENLTDEKAAELKDQLQAVNPLNNEQASEKFDKDVIDLVGRQIYFEFLSEELTKAVAHNNAITTDNTITQETEPLINWTNGNNNNDFVCLIYGLFHAGFINNGKGEILKIVEQAADTFNVKLSKNWRSNFSKSTHFRNADYEPVGIFDRSKAALLNYLQETTNKKDKRK